MINKRTSSVNHINVNSLSIGSTFEIGDSSHIQAFSQAIALQREQQLFFSNELQFSDFDLFTEPILTDPITEEITFETIALNPLIKVNNIKVTGISTSSLLHIGNSRNVYMEARVKHIRQLKPRE